MDSKVLEELCIIKNIRTGEIKLFSGIMTAKKFMSDNIPENKKLSDWRVLYK